MNQPSTVFDQDNNLTTYNRQNKDFAQWEKQDRFEKREQKTLQKQQKLQNEQQYIDQYRIGMNNNIQDFKAIDRIKKNIINNNSKITNLNGIQLRNPITQQLLLSNDQLNDITENNIQASLFQGKKRYQNSSNLFQNQPDDQKQFMQGKKRDIAPPESKQIQQMQGKHRNEQQQSHYLKKSLEEQNMFQGKKRQDIPKLINETQDQMLMQRKKRYQEKDQYQHNKSLQDEQLFKAKNRISNLGFKVSENFPLISSQNQNLNQSYIPIKEFQGKKRNIDNYNKYMFESQNQQQQFQGKKRVEQSIIPHQNDDLIIQKKKRMDNIDNFKQTDSLQVLMQSKKRDFQQNINKQEQIQSNLFQGKKRLDIHKSLDSNVFQISNDNPYLKL